MSAMAHELQGKPGYRLKDPTVPYSKDQENAVWDYFQKKGPGMAPLEILLVAIDSRLPYWGPESVKRRERALTEILARLQQRFGSKQNWESEAVAFLDKVEGKNWMSDRFTRDEEYSGSGAEPEHSFWNMSSSLDTVCTFGIAVIVVALPITIWYHRTRLLAGA